MTNSVKLGVSIYSFSKDFYRKRYTIEDCVRHVADMGIDGIEVVGAQMLRGYPWPTDAAFDEFANLSAKYGVKVVSYGSNTDFGIRTDRDLTEEELYTYAMHDLRAAHRLGCTVMRAQYLMSAKVMGRLAPAAERMGIKVGVEMHSPESPSSPKMQEYLKMIREVGSPNLGFVVDFGSFADKPNRFTVERHLKNGANPEFIAALTVARFNDMPRGEAMKLAESMKANEADLALLSDFYSFTTFRKPEWEGLVEIMPHVVHCHGKFYALDPQDGDNDVSIPYDRILPLLRDNGFDGYVMTEYEGMDNSVDVLDLVQRQVAMERRILGV